ncbi:transposase [Bizionia myxarmorum]|uniref:Transposase n=1 Tax=Bizionia myxarmorum TaxID=291186 RepID=A0A5D0R0M7_9FLAO|nr:transposase [Bizionia myxarmorum]TYB74034.1 transposase [Bizionia myxarmorum]
MRPFYLGYGSGTLKKEYRGTAHQCKDCSIKLRCLGKTAKEKKFSVTYYKAEYERNIKRVNSTQGSYKKGKRQSMVEPVFGTLTQFMGLRKINTIGINQTNKVMYLAAIAYNLKKHLKFTQKLSKTKAKALVLIFSKINGLQNGIIFNFHQPKFN